LRVSLEWLKEYVDIEMGPDELASALSMAGLEVERTLTLGGGVEGVVVGEVREVKPHPAADSLMLAVVDDGVEVREVVCGAPNLRAGMKSPFARVGARLPAVTDKPLKKARIRGVESEGMLLAADELGLSDDHTVIIELSPDSQVGLDVHEVLPLEDIVLELEITPNRPDCMCVVGIAREVSAVTGAPLKLPPVDLEETGPEIDGLAKVILEDPVGCPRYTARAVIGVSTAPSPAWMQRRLTAAGMRPISNIVDVTNYVLLELGQPLHAFDLDLLADSTIVVRRAAPGEPITTLDGVDRQLDENSLVIADAKEAVAIAGVIGGEDSEVTDRSVNILIESAHFDPTSILLTSRRLDVRTEASTRFERGVDPGGTAFAAARAARLMNELAGGQVARGVIDAYPAEIVPPTIRLRTERANALLGTDIPKDNMARILAGLGVIVEQGEDLSATVPTFRPDLVREIDLVEEVARIHGYDRIEGTVPRGGGFDAGLTCDQSLEVALRKEFAAQGASQVIAYSFMKPDDLELLELTADDPRRRMITLMNPIAETGEAMRTTMVPGLLRIAAGNVNRGNKDLAFFELGRNFIADGDGKLPREVEGIGLLLCGDIVPAEWSQGPRPADIFDLKGILENAARGLGVEGLEFEPGTEPFLAPGRAARVTLNGEAVGYLGQLHPRVAAGFGLEDDVFVAEVEASPLLADAGERIFSPVGRFPNVKVDIAVVVEEAVQARSIEDIIWRSGGELLKYVRLFDLYRGPQVGDGKKSLAYALEFGSPEATLTDDEAHGEMDRIIDALVDELGASIRGREREGEAP
jgi:phenylalanyl-tRNA synthetase beta chain